MGDKVLGFDAKSHPVRGAWIEIMYYIYNIDVVRSHPVRGAWIEIRIE